MARPTKSIKKVKRYTVRFTHAEDILVRRTSLKFGLTVSEFIRIKCLDISIKPVMTNEELLVYRDLIGVANNLNQLTKLSHLGSGVQVEIKDTLKRINNILNQVR